MSLSISSKRNFLIGAQMKQGEVKQALADAQYLLQLQPEDNELRDFVRQLAPQVR